MATKKLLMPTDDNYHPIPIMALSGSHDVDGSNASTQSSAIEGYIVRIKSLDNQLRFVIGDDPTAVAASPALEAKDEIYQPVRPGQKVAILGGRANICTAGI